MKQFFRTAAHVAGWALLAVWAVVFALMIIIGLEAKRTAVDTEIIWSMFGLPTFTAFRTGDTLSVALGKGALILLLVPLAVGVAVATAQLLLNHKLRQIQTALDAAIATTNKLRQENHELRLAVKEYEQVTGALRQQFFSMYREAPIDVSQTGYHDRQESKVIPLFPIKDNAETGPDEGDQR